MHHLFKNPIVLKYTIALIREVITIINFFKKLLKKKKKTEAVVENRFIVTRAHHSISKTDISENALKVLNRLQSSGFQAYLVGGSVRDLLLRKAPKDFDIATNATPNQIRQLFRNCRIIGRRFKLAHVIYYREIIEVATFRAHSNPDESQEVNEQGMLVRDNVYGSMDQDAWRRDFTVNSLYYNSHDSTIVDYTGGVEDLHKKRLRIIGDPNIRYQEDPVRMIRAIRFAAKLHFTIEEKTEKPLFELNHLIEHVSGSRLFDEMIKLYQCGEAQAVHNLLVHYGFFSRLFPHPAKLLNTEHPISAFMTIALENTDARIREDKPVNPAFLFAVFLWFPLLERTELLKLEGVDPLPALERAMSEILSEQCRLVAIPKRFTLVIREIWLLQYRFSKRAGHRAFNLITHPRFRAAYDFLALRALIGDESMELADWWAKFQEVDEDQKLLMTKTIEEPSSAKRRRRRRPKVNS